MEKNRILKIIFVTVLAMIISLPLSTFINTVLFPQSSNITENLQNEENKNILTNTNVEKNNNTELPINYQTLKIEKTLLNNGLLEIHFNNKEANIEHIYIKNTDLLRDNNEILDLIEKKDSDLEAFKLSLGLSSLSNAYQILENTDNTISFSRMYEENNNVIEIIKTYTLAKDEYMFKLDITYKTDSENFHIPKRTLLTTPQLGPSFQKLDARTNIRRSVGINDHKIKPLKRQMQYNNDEFNVSGIESKFFALMTISQKSFIYDEDKEKSLFNHTFILDSQDLSNNAYKEVYYVYAGPKNEKTLSIYNQSDLNEFKLENIYLNALVKKGLLFPIQELLRYFLKLFYALLNNWGLAIIALTILVKLFLYPLTQKSYLANAELQKFQPQIKELQDKYKDDPTKLNQEMMKLYQKEGVNPLSGCLPMLIQMPIFFSLYGIFNNFLDFRGANFITGWIMDLSQPDSVFHFSNNFTIPVLGWTDIRLLPLIMVGTQLTSTLLTSRAQLASNPQMKVMLIGMPVMFFFVLYNMPSGLLIYWISSNTLTSIQQWYINTHLKKQ